MQTCKPSQRNHTAMPGSVGLPNPSEQFDERMMFETGLPLSTPKRFRLVSTLPSASLKDVLNFPFSRVFARGKLEGQQRGKAVAAVNSDYPLTAGRVHSHKLEGHPCQKSTDQDAGRSDAFVLQCVPVRLPSQTALSPAGW